MALKETLQAEKIAAFKNGDKKTVLILGVLIGELEQKGKTSTDEEVITAIKKMLKNAEICGTTEEAEVLGKWIPKVMTKEETEAAIVNYVSGLSEKPAMGIAMKYLRDTYGTKLDMKSASQILAEKLK